MNYNELISGQVYTDEEVIFNSIKENLGIGFRLSGEAFINSNNWSLNTGKLRLANYDEIIWLKSCINANKFVPKPENTTNDNYEIY